MVQKLSGTAKQIIKQSRKINKRVLNTLNCSKKFYIIYYKIYIKKVIHYIEMWVRYVLLQKPIKVIAW